MSSNRILSDIIIYMKYAKYLDGENRRETWDEIINRNKNMHLNKYPHLKTDIEQAYQFVYDKKILPSMRSLQFAGIPIECNNTRIYNCCFIHMNDYTSFQELMFLLLSGTGVGYSVQNHHIKQLPPIIKPIKTKRFIIADSIEGWCDAVKVLIKAYLCSKILPLFDFSDIRARGEPIKKTGNIAPGSDDLRNSLISIQQIFDNKNNGDKLTSLDVHDINCYIANAVIFGGIRRSAMISIFDIDDIEMLNCKTGNWWEHHSARARANNSVVIDRQTITKEKFQDIWKMVSSSHYGEPGIFFTNNKELGLNPCAEISLKPYQFCNLTTINTNNIENQEDFNIRCKWASFIGTLQAGYTDFHYLRPIWKETTEKDSLIGVSLTGVASGKILNLNIKDASNIVKNENIRVSKLIGINPALRTTCIKPEGTSSLVLECSSGIHSWHNDYYIRRVRVDKVESIYKYLLKNHPQLLEDDIFSKNQSIISIPIKAPENSITRHESALNLLNRIKHIYQDWIIPGHVDGENTNNVSATVNIKQNEWNDVGEWLWENKNNFIALSFLPFDGGKYVQAPYEDIDEETYNKMVSMLGTIDISKIKEKQTKIMRYSEFACSGGKCDV